MKKIITLIIFLVISTTIAVSIKYYTENSVSFQMEKLKHGSTSEKIRAMTFMSDNKVLESIPLLIENIDNQERGVWSKEPKGENITISCVATYALENIIGNKIGNTCYEYEKKDWQYNEVKENWAKWYWDQQKHLTKTYINKELGFKINYPESIYDWDCKYETTNVPIKIFEDNENKTVYIAREYYYGSMENSDCVKVNNSLEYQKKINNSEDIRWKIVFNDVKNEDELNNFIKNYLKQDCKMAEETPTVQKGVFDVYMIGLNGKWGPDDGCWINWMMEFKYFPAKNKVATWDIGQEYMFLAEPKYYLTYDEEMADSFRFLE